MSERPALVNLDCKREMIIAAAADFAMTGNESVIVLITDTGPSDMVSENPADDHGSLENVKVLAAVPAIWRFARCGPLLFLVDAE